MLRTALLVTLAGLQVAGASSAQSDTGSRANWPHWRGPQRSGVSLETDWKSEGATEPLWSAEVGIGYSCPSIAGGRLVIAGFDVTMEEDSVICFDAESGEELWRAVYPAQIWNREHGGGTLTTPAIANGRVYVTTREGELRCLDADDGTVLWMRHIATENETEPNAYGFGGSPLVLDDKLICNVGKTVAIDSTTGDTLWATRHHLAMYSTPTTFELDGERTIATFTKEGLFLLDEQTGEQLRFHPFRKGNVTVNASTPVIAGDNIFVSSGYGHGCTLVDVTSEAPTALWESKSMRTQHSGCVLVGESLFGFDQSTLKCLDISGKEQWRKRGLGMGALMASADGRLLVIGEDGAFVVAAASPDGYTERSRRQVFDSGPCWTSPVLAGGLVYLRNHAGELVCLDHR